MKRQTGLSGKAQPQRSQLPLSRLALHCPLPLTISANSYLIIVLGTSPVLRSGHKRRRWSTPGFDLWRTNQASRSGTGTGFSFADDNVGLHRSVCHPRTMWRYVTSSYYAQTCQTMIVMMNMMKSLLIVELDGCGATDTRRYECARRQLSPHCSATFDLRQLRTPNSQG